MAYSILKALALVSFVFCADAARMRDAFQLSSLEKKSSNSDSDEEPPILCDEQLVDEACFILNGGEKHARGEDWTNSEALGNVLSATDASMSAFWEAAGLSTEHEMADGLGYWVTCEQLCSAIVDYGEEHGIMPPTSDMACYNVGMLTSCDLPMKPAELADLGPKPDEDLPDFHDEEVMHKVGREAALIEAQAKKENRTGSLVSLSQELGAEDLDYDNWELAERIANIFRIYPTKKPEPEEEDDNGNGSSLAETSSWPGFNERLHAQKLAQSKGYMNIVIRAVNEKKTSTQMGTWFGSRAFNDQSSRREIQRVLNSVDHMISNVQAVYEGPQCSPNTYAYVYPRAYTCSSKSELKRRACTKLGNKFVFYLCSLYQTRQNEMIETLVHEGSHHATSYTDDVDFEGGTAYGRSVCKRLARSVPSKAIKNADNFCYYIQDVATQVSVSPGSSAGPVSPPSGSNRCFANTLRTTPDSDGDCKCRSGYRCYTGHTLGCAWSGGSRSTNYGKVPCSTCQCKRSF